jgi:hypothetical protein
MHFKCFTPQYLLLILFKYFNVSFMRFFNILTSCFLLIILAMLLSSLSSYYDCSISSIISCIFLMSCSIFLHVHLALFYALSLHCILVFDAFNFLYISFNHACFKFRYLFIFFFLLQSLIIFSVYN